MVGPKSFKNGNASGSQPIKGNGPRPQLVKRPKMVTGVVSQPTSQLPSARGFLPAQAVSDNDQLAAAGFNAFGFRSSSSNSNSGRPNSASRPGSATFIMHPVHRQESFPNPQVPHWGAHIPVYSPTQMDDLHSQASSNPIVYNQQSQYNGQFSSQQTHQQSQRDGELHSQHRLQQLQCDGQINSQHSHQQPQDYSRFHSHTSQSLPSNTHMGQMGSSPVVANLGMHREVHSADMIQPPGVPSPSFHVPKRPPVSEILAAIKKRTAAAEEIAGRSADMGMSRRHTEQPVTDPTTLAPARTPIQRPARAPQSSHINATTSAPSTEPIVPPTVPAPLPQQLPQHSPEAPEVDENQDSVDHDHHERVTRTLVRAVGVTGDNMGVSQEPRNHSNSPPASSPSFSAPTAKRRPRQSQQQGQSKRSVGTATDLSSGQPPNEKIKVTPKRKFQELLKADDILNVAIKNGTANLLALEAAMLGKLMVRNDKFSEYVESVLDGMN